MCSQSWGASCDPGGSRIGQDYHPAGIGARPDRPRRKRPQAPIPTVLNLSSWAETRVPFNQWIVDRLNIEYQVPKKVGRRWLEGGQLVLLLDGLDEVVESHRNECVEAINTFRRDYRLVERGIVVCSRIRGYNVLTERLNFENAITLQPLTLNKAETYLDHLGEKWASLKQALHLDGVLLSFTSSPLWGT